MAKFDAGSFEELEWDFTKYGGGQGVITEPSTGKVNRFRKDMKALMKEVRKLQAQAESIEKIDLENMDDEQLTEAMSQVDEAESGAEYYQEQMMRHLAILCGAEEQKIVSEESDEPIRIDVVGGSPSLADLQTLPYRLLQEFSTWLIQEIAPKKTAPAGRR